MLILSGSSTFSIALIISESLPTPDGSIMILSGLNFSTISFIDFEKSPTREQHMHPELISLICTPLSFKNAPSTPISPNSFSIKTTFSFLRSLAKSFFIKVVLPAPRNPEITSILIIQNTSFILFAAPSRFKRDGADFKRFYYLLERTSFSYFMISSYQDVSAATPHSLQYSAQISPNGRVFISSCITISFVKFASS